MVDYGYGDWSLALPKNKISRFLIYHVGKLYRPYYLELIKSG